MVIDPPRRFSRADRGEGHKLAAGEDVVVDHVFLEIVDQATNFGPNQQVTKTKAQQNIEPGECSRAEGSSAKKIVLNSLSWTTTKTRRDAYK